MSETAQTQTELPLAKDATPKKESSLTTTKSGSIALKSLSEQMAFAKKLMDEGMVSETFKNPSQVVIGFQYAKALAINEILALKMMYVIKGKPSLYGDGPLALCQRKGLVSDIEEFFFDENHDRICFEKKNTRAKVFGSCTRVWRKGSPLVQEDIFTLDDLARAKIDIGQRGRKDVWEKFERNMMRYKARSMALKTKFADLIAGIPIAEYDNHFSPETPEFKEVTNTIADDMNREYSDESVDPVEPVTTV